MLPDLLPRSRTEAIEFYSETLGRAAELDEQARAKGEDNVSHLVEAKRWLGRNDLFFLLTVLLHRPDINHDWLFARCREVQDSPNGHLDLWAREHYKSTIITFGQSVLDILASHGENPEPRYHGREVTIGIFSHTKSLAGDFLDQIKQEFEQNNELKALYPDVLYEKPERQAPSWSKSDGITVRRTSNPRECTVEAHGLVDGQPTGKHFFIMAYDDVVVEESVATPDQIAKTTKMWELSDNLGTEGGWKRYAGTRYHLFDTYAEMESRGSVDVRVYPCTFDGTEDFSDENCVLKAPEYLATKRKDQGPYTFPCQMLLNPTSDKAQGFKTDWLKYWPGGHSKNLNRYIIVDPASGKKRGPGATTGRNEHAKSADNDYTVMEVVGLGPDNNYYTLDRVRDRLNPTERVDTLFALHKHWTPLRVGYEEYGMQSDIHYINRKMEEINYRFDLVALGGNQLTKPDRIKQLIPIYEQGRWYELEGIVRTDWEGKTVNLTRSFIVDEYEAFPVLKHDDILDAKARILDPDLGAEFPKPQKDQTVPAWMKTLQGKQRGSWMAR